MDIGCLPYHYGLLNVLEHLHNIPENDTSNGKNGGDPQSWVTPSKSFARSVFILPTSQNRHSSSFSEVGNSGLSPMHCICETTQNVNLTTQA